jgi:thiol-disulfide isomerase/thioredoxin
MRPMLRKLVALALWMVAMLASGCGRKSKPVLAADAAGAVPPGLVALPPAADRALASDFAGATAWLNADRALVPADLDGRVVVIDFWTSCCINCLHTLPILTELEKKYAREPVLVIGVHSPKFDAETESERLHAAIAENDITHPVAVDGSMKVWNAWKAEAWPTVLVLDAKRRIVWRRSGEPNKTDLNNVVDAALAEGRSQGILKTEKLAALKPESTDTGPLAFPGKIVALEGGQFAVSDTGHHRVVVLDASFAVKDVIGTGLAGMTDGGYAEASFRKPQGLAAYPATSSTSRTPRTTPLRVDRSQGPHREDRRRHRRDRAQVQLRRARQRRARSALRSPWDRRRGEGQRLRRARRRARDRGVYDPKRRHHRALGR